MVSSTYYNSVWCSGLICYGFGMQALKYTTIEQILENRIHGDLLVYGIKQNQK